MSTKTLRKRIALVAVSALGFGLLSVAPSSAANRSVGDVKSLALAASASPTAGSEVTVTSTYTMAQVTDHGNVGGDTVILMGSLTSVPSGGATAITAADGTVVTCTVVACTTGNSLNKHTITIADNGLIANNQTGTAAFKFTPPSAVPGSYTMTVWHDGGSANNILDAGEVYQTLTITVGSVGQAPTLQFAKSDDTTATTDAAAIAGHKVTTVGIQSIQPSGRTGVHGAFAPRYLLTRNALATPGAAVARDLSGYYANLRFTITNPAGTAVSGFSSVTSTTAITSRDVAGNAGIALTSAAVAQTSSVWTAGDQIGGTVYFPMATAGAYTVTVWHDQDLDGLIDAGEASAQSTFQANTDAVPSITMSVTGQTTPAASAANTAGDQLLKVSLKNGTLAASLGANESMTVTGPTGTCFENVASVVASGTDRGLNKFVDTGSCVTTYSLTSSNFDGSGNAYMSLGNTTAGGGTYSITAQIVGGTANGGTGSVSHTVVDTTTNAVATTSAQFATNKVVNTKALLGVAGDDLAAIAAGGASGTGTWTIPTGVATTVTGSITVGAVATKTYTALVTDTLGLVTGLKGATYGLAQTTGASTVVTSATAVTFSVAVPALAASQTNALTIAIDVEELTGDAADTQTITITNAARAATYTFVNPAADAATYSLRAAVASANKFTASVVDQFGSAATGVSVAMAISGRNSTTIIAPAITDVNGQVSYTLTDVYTGTFLLTDTLTFTPSAGAAGTVTVNYATYLPAAKITMTTPDSATATASGVAGTVKSDINAGSKAGPSATVHAVSVVLTDANGATLPAGVPVTFTITGNTGAAILSTVQVVNTDSVGKAATSVYAWLNGNATVTATAGTVSASGIVYFQQADAVAGVQAEARTLTAKASGNIVSAKVTDRFGNPIKGIILSAIRVGTGSFGGASSTTGTTDAEGSVDFILTNGTADVTVAFSSTTFGQTSATKGFLDAGITAFTAYTAGTVSTAETGVGASFADAGVNSVTVKAVSDTAAVDSATAAADAAAEATDAANAATDAANAAAEAADAATAAAQDAADAVAALSTQVTELVSALRKQITSLTNLVIKIQRKVRA
jgi:trimeric autotransporter adhesin